MASITKDEPVLILSAAGAVVAWLLGLLVTHGVLSDTQASSLTQVIVPAVAGVIVLVIGFFTRRLVSPAAKVKAVLESSGLLNDADFGRLEAMLTDKLEELLHVAPLIAQGGELISEQPPAPG
jgi:hypothetical protein